MMLFFGQEMKIALPVEKLAYILQSGTSINIFFHSGEYVTLDDSGATVPKIDCKTLRYETVDLAEHVMRGFYTACEKGKGAYYFG